MTTINIKLQLECADVMNFKADVLVLKYAQGKYGVDRMVSHDLSAHGIDLKKTSPNIGHSVLVNNVGKSKFKQVLFIGVKHLGEFGYKEIKRFSTHALNILKEQTHSIGHIAMTIHGTGYGLDESEAFLSQVAGIFDGIQSGGYPKGLKKITIIEVRPERVARLQKILDDYLSDQSSITKQTSDNAFSVDIGLVEKEGTNRIDNIISAGEASHSKKHIFVAMPFKEDMTNTFHFGIEEPIHKNNFLCERIDQSTFVGDIVSKVKSKIATASAIVADLTENNPNVYLEIGYAWGVGKPTILIIEKNDAPKFDLQSQRHIKYSKDDLKWLQDKLTKEIRELVENGEIQ